MSFQEIPVDQIQPSPFNTRGEIQEESLESLVQSIRETGLVESLKVRTVLDGAYELVSGERRLRAMKILGIEHASCTVREMSDAEVLLEQWAENEEWEDLMDASAPATGEGYAAGARDVSVMRFFHGGELGVKPKEAS
jgi:ParB family chromosome partitioning protein